MQIKLFQRIKTSLVLVLMFTFCFALCSCGMKAEQKSVTSQFDVIDALIAQNQFDDAISELKKIQKQIYDSWSYIGVYKRYMAMGEKKSAEKIIKKALKTNSHNVELIALYSFFLLRENRLDEAEVLAKELKGTKYGSIYSEAILKKSYSNEEKLNLDNSNIDDFYQIFMDAYRGSNNPLWLRNCAVMDMIRGDFSSASALLPEYFLNLDDIFFWSTVLYDSSEYSKMLEVSENANKFFDNSVLNEKINKLIALESDSYIALHELDLAEQKRREILSNINDESIINYKNDKILPIIMQNSAVWSMNQGNENDCGKLLFKIVNNWPDFVPSLVLYSNYAYTSNLKRTEDYETKMLRQAGISSLEMIEYDNRFVVPLSDAFERINNALITNKNPYLYICKLDLKYKMNEKLSVKDKTADLWNLLENNNENNEYKSILVQYAVNFLLKTNQNDDAWSVFYKYVTSFYNFNSEEDFWIQFEKNLSSIDYNIIELASYFAAEQKLRDEMFRISEYCVYESSGILKENEISSKVSSSVCMNLSDAYFSTGKVAKSLDLYGRTAGKEANSKVRSEIYYRIGEIYLSLGESADALRALDYSYSINKDNVKAQFLRDKISSDRK